MRLRYKYKHIGTKLYKYIGTKLYKRWEQRWVKLPVRTRLHLGWEEPIICVRNSHRRIYDAYVRISVTILLPLWAAKSPTRVSQQEEDASAILIKSHFGHTKINKKTGSSYVENRRYAYD
jgi:hypothetical protein